MNTFWIIQCLCAALPRSSSVLPFDGKIRCSAPVCKCTSSAIQMECNEVYCAPFFPRSSSIHIFHSEYMCDISLPSCGRFFPTDFYCLPFFCVCFSSSSSVVLVLVHSRSVSISFFASNANAINKNVEHTNEILVCTSRRREIRFRNPLAWICIAVAHRRR